MITADGCEVLSDGDESKMHICSFMWTYYGYPNAVYEGVTVETMRTRNGEIMAENDIKTGKLPDVDYVCGIPDSGVPHAIGYANKSGIRSHVLLSSILQHGPEALCLPTRQ